MAWNGNVGPFVVGVTRAVVAAVVLPALGVMFGLHAYVVGARAALQHGAVGFVLSLIAVECLLRPEKLPLTCSARPAGNLKALAPIYLMVLFVVAYNVGRLEQWALTRGVGSFAILVCGLVLTYGVARLFRLRGRLSGKRSTRLLFARVEIDDVSDAPTQRLGLSEPV